MKFCHYKKNGSNTVYVGHLMYYVEDACCGEPAVWKIGISWFCATHYDLWVKTYGDPPAIGVL